MRIQSPSSARTHCAPFGINKRAEMNIPHVDLCNDFINYKKEEMKERLHQNEISFKTIKPS